MALKEHADIHIIPDDWIEKFPVYDWGTSVNNMRPLGFHEEGTNTIQDISPSDSLENTILPAKTDGTSVIQGLGSGLMRILD